MQTNLYLAYGSNLNLAQMRYRCPDARVVGYTYLPGMRLVFRGSQSGNYLTLAAGDSGDPRGVPCGVFEISERDHASLDRYEGYPRFYRRDYVQTGEIFDALTGRVVSSSASAMIYLMQPGHPLALPSGAYWRTCLQGYRDFHFDPRILDRARLDSGSETM